MAGEVSKPHDHLFRSVFGENREAEPAGFIDDRLRPIVPLDLEARLKVCSEGRRRVAGRELRADAG